MPVTLAEIDRWCADEATLEATFFGEIAQAADPVIVHSPLTARLDPRSLPRSPQCISRSAFTAPQVPEALAQKAAARRRLRLPDGQPVIVSFGYVHASKAPADAIWALEIMRGWGFHASLHFVGSDEFAQPLHALVKRLGLEGRVVFLNCYVTEQTYRDYLVGADGSGCSYV